MMPNKKVMTTIKKMLASSKANAHKTHGSMGNIKGSYGLNREDIHYIFSNYSDSDKYIFFFIIFCISNKYPYLYKKIYSNYEKIHFNCFQD